MTCIHCKSEAGVHYTHLSRTPDGWIKVGLTFDRAARDGREPIPMCVKCSMNDRICEQYLPEKSKDG